MGGESSYSPPRQSSTFMQGDAPDGFNNDLPPPEPINSSLMLEAGPVIDAFGEYAASCLYSKNWMHREAALV